MTDYQILRIEFGTPEYDEAIALRYEILRKPLGMQYNTEDLAKEYDQYHLAYYDRSGRMVGYLNLTPISDVELKMRQVAVAAAMQGKGVGTRLVAASEDFAKEHGFQKITLHARETAVLFYERIGYQKIGERFEEVGIPHFKMEKI